MSKVEYVKHAVSLHDEGFSCAQALLASYGQQFGIEPEIGLKLGTAFLGGTAQDGQICGAITGALMIIGLKYGQVKSEDKQARQKTIKLSKELMAGFQSHNGTLLCKDLRGFDVSTPEGREERDRRKKNGTMPDCYKFVQNAAEIMEKIL